MSNSESNYALCCCCLELACSKCLWSTYTWMGNSEVYGEMLKDCFNVMITKQEDISNAQICEVCISQIRNSYSFKKQVIENQRIMLERLQRNEDVYNTDTKAEFINDSESIDYFSDGDNFCIDKRSSENSKEDKPRLKKESTVKRSRRKGSSSNGSLSDKYRLPRKNVQQILQYSTICPFKSLHGYFGCFFCGKQYVLFEELRAHTKENHDNLNENVILKCIYRPHDKVKADVSDITCKLCALKFDSLQNLTDHLTRNHAVKFRKKINVDPSDCIVGYDLSDGRNRCSVCKVEFSFFKMLTKHMNEHGTNFICDTCGRSFLSKPRLRVHQRFHSSSMNIKCEFCDKICASKLLLRSHKNHAHSERAFVCLVCNETFKNYKSRLQHLEDVHGRVKIDLVCKICSKKYVSPSSLTQHMRSVHQKRRKEAKLGCKECGKLFKTKRQLLDHELTHTGVKNYECDVCHKRYVRDKALKVHLKIHRNDKRWSCAACGQAFIQKCSLRSHIRVHHVDLDAEQLIVYKKPNENKNF